jgi:hypothetical protein
MQSPRSTLVERPVQALSTTARSLTVSRTV